MCIIMAIGQEWQYSGKAPGPDYLFNGKMERKCEAERGLEKRDRA